MTEGLGNCEKIEFVRYNGLSKYSIFLSYGIWKCDVNEKTKITVSTDGLTNYNDYGEVVSIHAVKMK